MTPRQLERATRLYKVVMPMVIGLAKKDIDEGCRAKVKVNLDIYTTFCGSPSCLFGYCAMDNVFVSEGLHISEEVRHGKEHLIKFGRKATLSGDTISRFFGREISYTLDIFDGFHLCFDNEYEDLLDRRLSLGYFLISKGVNL